jgi:hypothetical protein
MSIGYGGDGTGSEGKAWSRLGSGPGLWDCVGTRWYDPLMDNFPQRYVFAPRPPVTIEP